MNGTALRLVGPGNAGAIAGTGGVPSYSMENRSAAVLLPPAAPRAAPAGMSTKIAPSDAGVTLNEYEAPLPANPVTPPWAAVPDNTTSPAPNPVTSSPNSTVNLIDVELVGPGCAAAMTGVGGAGAGADALLYPIENRSAAALGLPSASRAAPAGMSTSIVPLVEGETSNAYDEALAAEKLATPPWAAVPESATSAAPNPVTSSPNSTVNLIDVELVGLGCSAAIMGVGGAGAGVDALLYPIKNRFAAVLGLPAISRAAPARMSTSTVPSAVGAASNV